MRHLLLTAGLIGAAPAMAGEPRIALPAGPLGQAVAVLGRQHGVSIAVDPALWSRPVPSIAGRLSTRAALDRLAQASGAQVQRAGATIWRLSPRPRPAPPPPRPFVPLPTEEPPGEIVVIASKRAVPARWFPGTALRIDGGDLAFGGGAGGTERIVSRTASVGSTHLGQGRNKLFIRGIADSSFTGPAQAIVGQYWGDLRLGYNGADPSLQLYDVRAVEVLEGPQGTLYGSGALGGIIRMVPAAPDATRPGASLTAGLSSTSDGEPGGDIAAMLNLPVTDSVATRIVGYARREGGYIDKPLLGRDNANRVAMAGGRAAIGWQVAPDWYVEASGAGQSIDGRDSQYADEAAPPLVNNRALREGYRTGFGLGQLAITGRIGGVSLRSATGIVRQSLTERFDATLPGGDPQLLVQRQTTRMLTSETRAWQAGRDGSGWVAGLSLIDHRRDLDRRFVPPIGLTPTIRSGESVTEATLYGEGAVALTPRLLATAGGRLTQVELRGRADEAAPLALRAAPELTDTRTMRVALPSAALTWRLPAATLYARYQQGFRPGGLAIEGETVRHFLSDRLYALEAGARLGDEAGRWSAQFALSRSRWHGIQANYLDPWGLPSTANLGDGTIWSATLGLRWRPAPGWQIDAAGAVNSSRVTAFGTGAALFASARSPWVAEALSQAAVSALRLGGDIPNVADCTARLGVGYRAALNDHWDIAVDGWARYVGRSRLGIGPYLGEWQGDYVDSAATVRMNRGPFGISLAIDNLTDTRGNRFALGTPFRVGMGQVTPLRPRTLRLGLDARF
ncbi:TonB-dependent receptor [Sphingomonas sp. NY01]|uniref:TonB-dependent receptor n=1 Tax=Sphingomonas sp. NY01 TaxID=2968057 RepID=UPI00315DDCC8